METYPYLKLESQTPRKRFSPRKMLFFVFVVSLGLNFYFLLAPENENGPRAEALEQFLPLPSGEPPAEAAKPVPVKKALVTVASNAVGKRPFEVQRASFSAPDLWGGEKIHTLNFKIKNSLVFTVCRILSRQEGCQRLSAYIGRLLSWYVDVSREMQNGDTLSIVYRKVDNEERFKILKLVYQSGRFQRTFEANFFKGEGMSHGSYFDADGQEIMRRIDRTQSPIRAYREITSLPGDFRKGKVGHAGTDFKADIGTPVFASFDGRVRRTHWNVRLNGYCVELDHPREGVRTLYLHLSRVYVKRGQYVRQGQKIAESGNTGRTFAPHLHYEIKSRGKRPTIYNPFKFKYINTYHRKIAGQERARFEEMVRVYDSILEKG